MTSFAEPLTVLMIGLWAVACFGFVAYTIRRHKKQQEAIQKEIDYFLSFASWESEQGEEEK